MVDEIGQNLVTQDYNTHFQNTGKRCIKVLGINFIHKLAQGVNDYRKR